MLDDMDEREQRVWDAAYGSCFAVTAGRTGQIQNSEVSAEVADDAVRYLRRLLRPKHSFGALAPDGVEGKTAGELAKGKDK